MTLPLTVLWAIIVSVFSVLGAWYARRYQRADGLIGFYVMLAVFSNIVASKTIEFDFGSVQLFAPAAVILFSVTFLITDIVNERFGRAEAQRMILIAFFAQVALILFSYLIVSAKSAPFFTGQAAFALLLSAVPRVTIASLTSFFVSENVDAYLFSWLKSMTDGKYLWLRNAFSSIPAMAIDSALFVTLAFYGTMPIAPLIIGLITVKWIVGVVDIPFMYLARFALGDIPKEKAPFEPQISPADY